MKYPEILFLPVLMFADYFLTVAGAIQKERRHSEHFKAPHYELNPVWQKQIAQKRWFNPRHILLTVLVTGALACFFEFADVPNQLVEGVFGCLFVFFGAAIGRHVSNILIFRHMHRNPGQISGRVAITHSLSLFISRCQYLSVAVPLLLTAVFSPAPFTLGGVIGIGMLFVVHSKWLRQHKKQVAASTPAAPAPSP